VGWREEIKSGSLRYSLSADWKEKDEMLRGQLERLSEYYEITVPRLIEDIQEKIDSLLDEYDRLYADASDEDKRLIDSLTWWSLSPI
jgi:hypothetical protein